MIGPVFLLLTVAFALAGATAPLLNADAPAAISNQYIIVLHKNVTADWRDIHISKLDERLAARDVGEKVLSRFHIGDLIGYSAILSNTERDILLEDFLVSYIEYDQVVTILDEEAVEEDYDTQVGATWGIDRIDQRSLPLDRTFSYFQSAGAGVDVYVIDTGIFVDHNDFGRRASWGSNHVPNEGLTDGNGHGTHCASTSAGTVWGVAKKANVWAVKVLGASGSGTWAGVIDGINWVTNHHNNKASKLSIANMSLGGGVTPTVDAAVENSINAGVHYAIAAGNSNADACNSSPSRARGAFTAGATTDTDARSSFSNWGSCVFAFAPGTAVTAAWIGNANNYNTISGTSMASPHVAGLVALHLGHSPQNGGNNVVVGSWIIEQSTKNAVGSPNGSPNRLIFSPFTD